MGKWFGGLFGKSVTDEDLDRNIRLTMDYGFDCGCDDCDDYDDYDDDDCDYDDDD